MTAEDYLKEMTLEYNKIVLRNVRDLAAAFAGGLPAGGQYGDLIPCPQQLITRAERILSQVPLEDKGVHYAVKTFAEDAAIDIQANLAAVIVTIRRSVELQRALRKLFLYRLLKRDLAPLIHRLEDILKECVSPILFSPKDFE